MCGPSRLAVWAARRARAASLPVNVAQRRLFCGPVRAMSGVPCAPVKEAGDHLGPGAWVGGNGIQASHDRLFLAAVFVAFA